MKSKLFLALALFACSSFLFVMFVPNLAAQQPTLVPVTPIPIPSLIPESTPSPKATASPKATPTPTPTPTPTGSISPTPPPPGDNPCCGTKPKLQGIATFTGEIAVATHQRITDADPSVVIWNLTNQGTAPKNGTQWMLPLTDRYFHPSWVRAIIGDVKGLTLDGAGNIFAAATRVYGTNKVGAPLGGTAGIGDVYKLDANTGNATRFVSTDTAAHTYVANSNKMPNTGPGLGNIHYSCKYNRLYVTNLEDGNIYCVNPSGVFQSSWDHGANLGTATPVRAVIADTDAASNTSAPWTQLGRRVCAVQVLDDQCFYSVWTEHMGKPSATLANEIWSVKLDASGNFIGSAKLEISVPSLAGKNYSNPVFDISFSATRKMLLAERSMASDSAPSAHQSRVLEYVGPGAWTASPATFKPGFHGTNENAAGGCDYGGAANNLVWMTADYLSPTAVYGLQGTPNTGGGYTTSILLDLDTILGTQDKMHLGDVEISCSSEGPPATPTPTPPQEQCSAVIKEIVCKKGDGAGYTVTLQVTNHSGQPVIDVLLASPPGSSYTAAPAHAGPLANNASITIPVTITGGKPGDKACFTVTFMGEDGCLCTVEVCPVLPDCCAILGNEGTKVECNKDGTYTYTTTITNNSGSPKQFIYLYPPPGVTMTPDHFTLPAGGLAAGGVFHTPPITISGAKPGEFCFNISLHNKGMEGCCLSPHHCITLLPCDKQPKRPR